MSLAGCAGSRANALIPISQTASSVTHPEGTVKLTLVVPAQTQARLRTSQTRGAARVPEYVSSATLALDVALTPQGSSSPTLTQTFACSPGSCSAQFAAPAGLSTLALSLTDASNGGGNTLSLATTPITVQPNADNTFALVSDGVVHSVTLTPALTTINAGSAQDVPLTLSALDADGNTIVGPGSYVDAAGNPVTITLGTNDVADNGSGTVTLSQTTFTQAPAGTITAHYNGAWLDHTAITTTASSASVITPATVTVATTPAATLFPTGTSGIFGISVGADQNLWFGVNGSANVIGKITTGGVVTLYNGLINDGFSSYMTAPGPDGNEWFSEWGGVAIGEITPGGTVTEYGLPTFPDELVSGPDGRVWVTSGQGNCIYAITPSGVVSQYTSGITADPYGITVGPDHALWFTEGDPYDVTANVIGSITTGGSVTEYSAGITATAATTDIVSGPDGRLWFTENNTSKIGAITTAGVVTEYSMNLTPGSQPFGIKAGPDGNLWFMESATNYIGRITTSGVITEFPLGLPAGVLIKEATFAPDGNLWFTENGSTKIGKFVY